MKKMLPFSIIATIIILFAACASQNQATNEKKENVSQIINQKIQDKHFTVNATYANPMGGKSIYLTSEYNLIIRNDSAIAYLPYFGRAYSAPYGGGDGGIKFNELMTDYKASKDNKGSWNVQFKVNTTDYNYDVNVDIYSSGKANLFFNSNQRQSINFSGEIDLKE